MIGKNCKKVLISTAIILVSFSSIAHASVLSDIMGFFGAKNEQEFKNTHIEESVYNSLSDEEKEVVAIIDNIYDGIRNLDVDKVASYVDVGQYLSDVEYIKKVLNDNAILSTTVKTLIKGLNYKIYTVLKKDERITADVEYKCDGLMSVFIKDTGRCKFIFKKNDNGEWKLSITDELIAFINTVWENIN